MLPLFVSGPTRMLCQGVHCGYPWIVAHNETGYRCGYIKVPNGHPWDVPFSDRETMESIEVHGGVTYSAQDTDLDGLWIGFDCAHTGDAPDSILPRGKTFSVFRFPGDTVKDTSYVENECRKLCEQAHFARINKELQ